jgi:lipopolysaccharide transport system ATP-binding protein
MNSNPVLSLRKVGISYRRRRGLLRRDRFWAVREVSLDVLPGETLGVVGRNGAGKSSLLRIMAGIVRPERGEIETFGYRPCLLSIQAGFIRHLTGRENAILSGMLLGLRRREVEERLNEIIAFSELGAKVDEEVYTYSTGMRARLGFSVALHADPDILLLDEVLGAGDAEFREKSTAAMKAKIASRKTVVLVSHNQHLIEELCDRAVLLEGGKSVATGKVEEVMKAYRLRKRGNI